MSSSQPSIALLEDADSIVREYLTWRGFGSSLVAFGKDCKEDSLLGLSPERLVQKLVSDVEGLDLDSLFAWWDEGVGPLLSRVDEEIAVLGRGLRDASFRWYLVTCFQKQRTELVLDFFKRMMMCVNAHRPAELTLVIRPLEYSSGRDAISR